MSKVFRDPVHGYIAIDKDIVRDFIDTPQFQRLKRIKQTNLDTLFPTANQTRFEHSLGVFYLGCKLFNSLAATCPSKYKAELRGYNFTVQVACLLHDIGHAPMSHIGEAFYGSHHIVKIKQELRKIGIKISEQERHAPHELMSVLVGVKVFGTELIKRGYDKDLFFRLITGSSSNDEGCAPLTSSVKKAIIPILSSVFDVDKMDYIMRDSTSSGVQSVELDIDRIINAAKLVEHQTRGLIIAFGKSGFSVVSSIVNNRNYLYKWIYGHHKVQFHYNVLTAILKKLCAKESFVDLFSFKAITGTPVTFNKTHISYTDDHDLWHILKNIVSKDSHFNILRGQLFSRNHFVALWKTKIEFDQDKELFTDKLKSILTLIEPANEFFLKKIKPHIPELALEDVLIFKSDPKMVFPDLGDNVYFWMTNKNTNKIVIKTYRDLFEPSEKEIKENEIEKFMFHFFVNKSKYSPTMRKRILQVLAGI